MFDIAGMFELNQGPAVGDWSQTWHFQKKWYLQPQLLTPTNLYQTGLYPIYSWTPVPGASRYFIQIADNPSFSKQFMLSENQQPQILPIHPKQNIVGQLIIGGESNRSTEVVKMG